MAFFVPFIPFAIKAGHILGGLLVTQIIALGIVFSMSGELKIDAMKRSYSNHSEYPVPPGIYPDWITSLNQHLNTGKNLDVAQLLKGRKIPDRRCGHVVSKNKNMCLHILELKYKVIDDIYVTSPFSCSKSSCSVWTQFHVDPFRSDIFSSEQEFKEFTGFDTIFSRFTYRKHTTECSGKTKIMWFQPLFVNLRGFVKYFDPHNPDGNNVVPLNIDFPLSFNQDLVGFDGSKKTE